MIEFPYFDEQNYNQDEWNIKVDQFWLGAIGHCWYDTITDRYCECCDDHMDLEIIYNDIEDVLELPWAIMDE